ncbi:MAG: sulfatase-like hydrolase/transferase [Rhodobacteraceae bacterium]|nr:sulfatase-like hydrolase/transferase [Paracoccaceae bacterium]
MAKQPNFLFFITDQHRADWLGCYGHPVVKTPNIDAIAKRGTRFDRFMTASPVCMPNRASLLTGRYPTLHGLRYNGCVMHEGTRTFVDVLAEAGYHTAAIGKSHLQPFTGSPPRGSNLEDILAVPEARETTRQDHYAEEAEHYKGADRHDIPTPYYGYQHVDLVTEHGDKCGGHYQQWGRENVPNWEELQDPENELPHEYTCPQAFRTPVPEDVYPTAYVRDRAIDYLHSRSDEDAPFFAFVSFPDPHHPFNPPGKYWDMYDPEDFEVALPFEAHTNPTPPMQWLYDSWKSKAETFSPQTAALYDTRHIKEAMALTAGMITCVDDAVGEIMKALEASGQLDNTVVCFNADHGDYMGDFNMMLKGALPFDAITRVPFIWADPEQTSPAQTSTLCSTVDLAATILDRAGLTPFNGNQGVSFLDATRGGDGPRDEVLIEFNDPAKRLGFTSPARVRTLVTERWKYTVYHGQDWGELYDLENDPKETRNLWDNTAYTQTRGRLAERLTHHLIAQMDESPLADRIA